MDEAAQKQLDKLYAHLEKTESSLEAFVDALTRAEYSAAALGWISPLEVQHKVREAVAVTKEACARIAERIPMDLNPKALRQRIADAIRRTAL